MDNIKTWKNTAKRMIHFLPVTWKCCFYSAYFQPGGMFMVSTPVRGQARVDILASWYFGVGGWGGAITFCSTSSP